MPGFDVQRTLRDYMRILFRRKWLFLIPFVAALGVAGWWFKETPKKYRVTAQVKREDPVLLKELGRAGEAERGAETSRSATNRLAQRRELIRILSASTYQIEYDKTHGLDITEPGSPLDRWLSEGDWDKKDTSPAMLETLEQWDRLYRDSRWNEIIQQVKENIDVRVESPRGAAVQYIVISYTDESPDVAEKVCKALTATYILRTETGITARLDRNIKTLKGQLDTLVKKQLDPIREELETFEKENLGNLPKDTVALDLELKQRALMVQAIDDQIKVAMNDIARLQEALEKTPKVIVTEREHGLDPRVQQMQEEIGQLRGELRRLRLKYTEEHPDIQKVKRLIEEAEREMTRLPEEIEKGRREGPNPSWQWFKQQLDERRRELAELQDKFAAGKEDLTKVEAQKMEILERYRKFVALREAYAKLTDERQRLLNLISRDETERGAHIEKEGVRFEVVEYPVKPLVPAEPDPFLYLFLGLLAGVAGGTGLVVLAEHTDHSLRTVSEAARALQVPVVGTIGVIRSRARWRLHVLSRLARWMLLVGAAGGLVAGFLYLWGIPYYRSQIKQFSTDPRAVIHRWTGAGTRERPSIASLDLERDQARGVVTLTARNVNDVDGVVEEVNFYRDANGDGVLQVDKDELLGKDVSPAGGWTWSGPATGWPSGTVVCWAQARDNDGRWSAPVAVRRGL